MSSTQFGRRKTDNMSRWDRAMEWKGWRPLGALAAAILAGAILFGAFTLAQHTTSIDQENKLLHCIKLDFNQTLDEAFYHKPLHPSHCK